MCDETWPECQNCKKNNKGCPGPPARHTFRDLGPALQGHTISPSTSSTSLDSSQSNQNFESFNSTLSLPSSARPATIQQQLVVLDEKWSDSGAVFHKWRIGSRTKQPESTASMEPDNRHRSALPLQIKRSRQRTLSAELVAALSLGGEGQQLSHFGSYIKQIPGRLGHSSALDAVVACLVNAHASMLRKMPAPELLDPKLYLKAVKALQMALEDPRESLSENTLCATALLGIIESIAGPGKGNNYLTHAGGTAGLIEFRGIERHSEPFAKEIAQLQTGAIIMTSLYRGKPCFLASENWSKFIFNTDGLSNDLATFIKATQYMALYPDLVQDIKDLKAASPQLESAAVLAQISTRNALFTRLTELKASIYTLGLTLHNNLSNGSAAIELPSLPSENPSPTAFHFSSWRMATAYGCFWSLLILTNKLILKLSSPSHSYYFQLEQECRSVSLEILKTWENAWASRPVGGFHLNLSFIVAYEFCTPEAQEWIVRCLNALLDSQIVKAFRWTREHIVMKAKMLAGDTFPVM
ncbi:hypothetical protein AOQ84DRAFT_361845 [Glonium stellatum]|uniref:Uncharacterized protein n=1 Tax=Glonium stellatum TaxID=574774 RepID=A0A8E2F5T1_9PEZI|nr:hypothetical protein AOQ84DRAFT_361845 [Glonium stellatum]